MFWLSPTLGSFNYNFETQRTCYKSVHIMEGSYSQVSTSCRGHIHKSVHIMHTCRGHIHKSVHIMQGSYSQKCPHHAGVIFTKVSTSCTHAGVIFTNVSTSCRGHIHKSYARSWMCRCGDLWSSVRMLILGLSPSCSEGQEKYLRELSITPVGYFTGAIKNHSRAVSHRNYFPRLALL
jgi:hypothetical protein